MKLHITNSFHPAIIQLSRRQKNKTLSLLFAFLYLLRQHPPALSSYQMAISIILRTDFTALFERVAIIFTMSRIRLQTSTTMIQIIICDNLSNLFLCRCIKILLFDKNCHILILTKKRYFSKDTNYFTLLDGSIFK